MEITNFSAWIAQQRLLEASDVSPDNDLLAIGKKMSKLRNGKGYEEFAITVSEFTSVVAAGINTALDVTNIYVDATFGDDATALHNRFDKPYATLKAAHASATADIKTLIYVRRGSYTSEAIKNKNLIDWYFEPGTLVTNHRFDDDGSNMQFNVYGKAEFVDSTGDGVLSLRQPGTNVYFECKKATVDGRFLYIGSGSPSSLHIKMDVLISGASRDVSCIKVIRQAIVKIEVSETIIYGTDSTNSQGVAIEVTDGFAGKLDIICPLLVVITSKNGIYIPIDSSSAGRVFYKGTIQMTGSNRDDFRAAVYIFRGAFEMEGKILTELVSNLSMGILTDGDAAEVSGTVKFTGDITGGAEAIVSTNRFIPIFIKDGTISTEGRGRYFREAIIMGKRVGPIESAGNDNVIYIKNTFIRNTEPEPAFRLSNNSHYIWLYDVSIQLSPESSTARSDSGIAKAYCKNVYSTCILGGMSDVYSPTGFTRQDALTVPSF